MISNIQSEEAIQAVDAFDLLPQPEGGLQKDWRKIVKKKDKELEKYRREKDELSKQLKEVQQTVKMLKSEKYEQQKLLQNSNAENLNLKIEIDRLTQELAEKEKLIGNLSEQTIQHQVNELESEISRVRDKNSKLLSQNASYKNEIATIKGKLTEINLVRRNEQDDQLKRLTRVNLSLTTELNALKAKLETSEEKLRELQELQNIKQLVSVLAFKLRYETLADYDGLDSLISRVRFMRRVVHKKKHWDFYKPAPQKQLQEEVKYGYLIERGSWYWFVCISTEEIYRVGSNPMILKSDMPASAVVTNGWANILEIFEEDDKTEEGSKKLSSSDGDERTASKKSLSYDLNGIKVLIIGSRNLIKYRQALEQCGAEVETNNPFEQSIEMRRGAFRRADVVIICASHTPHKLLSPHEMSDEKVEVIKRDNIQAILARASFAMLRLNKG